MWEIILYVKSCAFQKHVSEKLKQNCFFSQEILRLNTFLFWFFLKNPKDARVPFLMFCFFEGFTLGTGYILFLFFGKVGGLYRIASLTAFASSRAFFDEANRWYFDSIRARRVGHFKIYAIRTSTYFWKNSSFTPPSILWKIAEGGGKTTWNPRISWEYFWGHQNNVDQMIFQHVKWKCHFSWNR